MGISVGGPPDGNVPDAKIEVVEGREVVAIWIPFTHVVGQSNRDPGLYLRVGDQVGYHAAQGMSFEEAWESQLPSLTNNIKAANGERPWG